MYRTSPKSKEPVSNVNARYREYLEDTRPQNTGKRRAAWLGLVTAAFLIIGTLVSIFTNDLLLAWPLAPVGAVLGVRSWFALRAIQASERSFERLHALVVHGIPVTGYLVQANEALFRPGNEEALPALVLFSFQSEVDEERGYMGALARKVYRLKNTMPLDPDGRFVASLTTDERAVPHRRRQLPLSFTDGSTIYCADIWIRRADLRGGCLTTGQLPCLAEMGEGGGIELVPASLLPTPTRTINRLDRRPV
jgi:hypothetical protein